MAEEMVRRRATRGWAEAYGARCCQMPAIPDRTARTDGPDPVESPPLLVCRVDVHVEDDTMRLSVDGEIDISTIDSIEYRVERARTERDFRRLVLDLRGTTFMDSTGLRLLLTASRHAQDTGYELVVVRPPAPVYRAIEVTGLDRVLRFVDDPADA